RAKILERTRRGRLHKLRTGQMLPFPGNPPYGYAIMERAEDVPKIVVINDVEAQQVRNMYRWAIEEGLSTRAIAKRLNNNGVPARKSGMWTQSGVHTVLTNPCYIGQAAYNKRESCEPKRPKKPGSYRKRLKSSMRRRPEDQWVIV